MQNKVDAIQIFIEGIESANKTWQEVALMSTRSIRNFIGEKARGLTRSFIQNMKDRQIKNMQNAEVQSAADWTISRIVTQFPNAEVILGRGRTFKVFLDGKPEEINE